MGVGGSGCTADGSADRDATDFRDGSPAAGSGFFFPVATGFNVANVGIETDVARGSWAAAASGTIWGVLLLSGARECTLRLLSGP